MSDMSATRVLRTLIRVVSTFCVWSLAQLALLELHALPSAFVYVAVAAVPSAATNKMVFQKKPKHATITNVTYRRK